MPLLFFFIQGLVFAVLLLRKGILHSSQSSKWLSLFILLCCMYITPWMTGHAGWYAKDGYSDFLFFVPFQQLFLIGPVVYFYTQSLLNPSFQLSSKHFWHFIPAILYLIYSLVMFVVDALILDTYYFYANGRDKDLEIWYQISGLISMIIYGVLSLRHYILYRQLIFQELSYADTVTFNWMKSFLMAFLTILSLRVIFLLLYPEWGKYDIKWWYYLSFGSLSYYIALLGYTNTIEFLIPLQISNFKLHTPDEDINQYNSSRNTDEDSLEALENWKSKVQELMETELLYQNPTLSLQDMAEKLGITSKQVSGIINKGFELNFNDFVNNYRVKAVQKSLQEGAYQQFTLLSIALNAGFNSKTTFNRVFKKITHQTPLQYLNQLKKGQMSEMT